MSNRDEVLEFISTILARPDPEMGSDDEATADEDDYSAVITLYHGALRLATTLYGADSAQVQDLREIAEEAKKEPGSRSYHFRTMVQPVARGCLAAMHADVRFGLVERIERRGSGEVLGDLLGLAKHALAERTDGSKNVAAVLTAAAYEDTLRKMAATLTSVTERTNLADVINALKGAGLLQGAALSSGQSFLKFRNDALHADWEKIDYVAIGTCMAFVEGLLVKHFSA